MTAMTIFFGRYGKRMDRYIKMMINCGMFLKFSAICKFLLLLADQHFHKSIGKVSKIGISGNFINYKKIHIVKARLASSNKWMMRSILASGTT